MTGSVRPLWGLLPLLLLTACAQVPPLADRPPVEDRGMPAGDAPAPGSYVPPAPVSRGTQTLPAASPAVVALLQRAEGERRNGEADRAAATLERALRIEPRNARLWTALAGVRLDQQRWTQVEQLALKSNQLASGDPGLQQRNWGLIAAARRGSGDAEGARVAERRAATVLNP